MFEDCKVELLETFGDDLTVVNAARVSLGKHTDEFSEKDAKLIKYLADHEHTSSVLPSWVHIATGGTDTNV